MNSLKDIAYQFIKKRILNCEILGGERIREDILAEELNISRTPVREAINQLIVEGLVKSVPRKGLYCVEMTIDSINDLCDMRYIHEAYAVKRNIQNCTPENIDEIVKLAQQFENAVKNNQSGADCDNRLHELLIHFAGNSQLISMHSLIVNHLHILYVMTETKAPRQLASKTAIDQHYLLLECLRNKDEALALATIEKHVEGMRTYLTANL